ncbi:InlB B-repeat-containing protein [Pseudobutyrivibrio xylanivorans]|uniref:Uncharacterized protein n=1 Tax=Pseudobutyrivibrio xylanivorans TaxID=185007 RepID=A0A1G5S0N1_PSEXY|nr:hypothetical protein [Pseudobutyrivibrio xylanivorans]SCZ79109.1 hypothetical protein SAMN02910350_01615 [Pseudobutyrivibrio xylanivorans]
MKEIKVKRILAIILVLFLIVTGLNFNTIADELRGSSGRVVAFEEIPDSIRLQEFTVGASVEEIVFPSTLTVTVEKEVQKKTLILKEKTEEPVQEEPVEDPVDPPEDTSIPEPAPETTPEEPTPEEPAPKVSPTPEPDSGEPIPEAPNPEPDPNPETPAPEEPTPEEPAPETPAPETPAPEPAPEVSAPAPEPAPAPVEAPAAEPVSTPADSPSAEPDLVGLLFPAIIAHAEELDASEETPAETTDQPAETTDQPVEAPAAEPEIEYETVVETVTNRETVVFENVSWKIDSARSTFGKFDFSVESSYVLVPEISWLYDVAANLPTIEVRVLPAESRPAFTQSTIIDGVKITVSADEGVFPEGVRLIAHKITGEEEAQVEELVDAQTSEHKNVASSYTFDISIVDASGDEVQPDTSRGNVTVSFETDEIGNSKLETEVYHIDDNNQVDELAVETVGDTVVQVETDGFSIYHITLSYEQKTYQLDTGISGFDLNELLEALEININGHIFHVSASPHDKLEIGDESTNWHISVTENFVSGDEVELCVCYQPSSGAHYNTSERYEYITLIMQEHVHEWTISKTSNTTIEARCSDSECVLCPRTATLVCDNKVYDGTAVTANFEKESFFPAIDTGLYTFSDYSYYRIKEDNSRTMLDSSPSEVGKYEVEMLFTPTGELPITLVKSFEITKIHAPAVEDYEWPLIHVYTDHIVITNVKPNYEYKFNDEADWRNTAIKSYTGLSERTPYTFYLRYVGDATHLPGEETEKEIWTDFVATLSDNYTEGETITVNTTPLIDDTYRYEYEWCTGHEGSNAYYQIEEERTSASHVISADDVGSQVKLWINKIRTNNGNDIVETRYESNFTRTVIGLPREVTIDEYHNGSVTITPSTDDIIRTNDTVTITCKPDDGYNCNVIVEGTDNGETVDVYFDSSSNGFRTYHYCQPPFNVTIKPVFTAKEYQIVINDDYFMDGVEVVASPNKANVGDTVRLTFNMPTDVRLKNLSITDATPVKVEDVSYEFTMPASNVTVRSTYERYVELTENIILLKNDKPMSSGPRVYDTLSVGINAYPVEYAWYYADENGDPIVGSEALSNQESYLIKEADLGKPIVLVVTQRNNQAIEDMTTPIVKKCATTEVEKRIPGAPNLSREDIIFDYINETMSLKDEGYEISFDGLSIINESPISLKEFLDNDMDRIYIRSKETDLFLASPWQTFMMPERADAPDVVAIYPTTPNGKGYIIGTASYMEYRFNEEGSTYKDADVQKTAVLPGEYLVREKARDGYYGDFAGKTAVVRVEPYDGIGTYTLRLSAANVSDDGLPYGSIEADKYEYHGGDVITIIIKPDEGCDFVYANINYDGDYYDGSDSITDLKDYWDTDKKAYYYPLIMPGQDISIKAFFKEDFTRIKDGMVKIYLESSQTELTTSPCVGDRLIVKMNPDIDLDRSYSGYAWFYASDLNEDSTIDWDIIIDDDHFMFPNDPFVVTERDVGKGIVVAIAQGTTSEQYVFIYSNPTLPVSKWSRDIPEAQEPSKKPTAPSNLTYTGQELELVVPGIPTQGTIGYSLSPEGPYTDRIPTAVEPGTYEVWWKVIAPDGQNEYRDSTPQKLVVTIKPGNNSSVITPTPGTGGSDSGNNPGGGTPSPSPAPKNDNQDDKDDDKDKKQDDGQNDDEKSNKKSPGWINKGGNEDENDNQSNQEPTDEELFNPETMQVYDTSTSSEPVTVEPNKPVTLKYGSGAIEVAMANTSQGGGAYGTGALSAGLADAQAAVEAILSDELLAMVENGSKVKIKVQTTALSEDSITDDEKDIIAAEFKNLKATMPNLKQAESIDISLLVKFDHDNWDAITTTRKPIEITVGISDEDKGKSEKFYILRVHEGETTLLEDLDEDDETITIGSDRFSTYTILYEDNAAKAAVVNSNNSRPFKGIMGWIVAGIALLLVFLRDRLSLQAKRRESVKKARNHKTLM